MKLKDLSIVPQGTVAEGAKKALKATGMISCGLPKSEACEPYVCSMMYRRKSERAAISFQSIY
jgi:hypothetical protein